MKNDDKVALSPQEAADRLGVSKVFVYELLRDGSLRSKKVRGRRLIPATALSELLDE